MKQRNTDDENDFEDIDSDYVQPASKSQRKREMHALLALTEQALSLHAEKLAKTGINEKTLAAFAEAKKMKASGARNRQLKYITKLISHEDTEILENYLQQANQAQQDENLRFHKLEKWRDRLVNEGDKVIGELLNEFPNADRQQLRTWIRQAQKESLQGKPPTASRKLFKYLRSLSE